MLLPILLAPCLGVSELTVLPKALSGPAAEGSAPALTAPQAAPTRPARLIMGDVDGDGRQDALGLAGDGTVTLLRNDGAAGFQDVTEASGLGAVEFATCAALVDLDADGALDLFLGSWSDRVWRNLGDGTFEPFRPGVQHGAVDLACNALDADGDGLVDLQLSTDQGDVLYRNLGAGSFAALRLPGVALVPGSGAGNGNAEDDPRAALGVRGRLVRWRSLTAGSGSAAAGGGSGPGLSAMMNPTNTPVAPQAPLSSTGICAETIADQATGLCIEASSSPTLGSLYPLSGDFNVSPSGRIGVGTTNPDAAITIGNVGNVTGTRLISFQEADNFSMFYLESGFASGGGDNHIMMRSESQSQPMMTWTRGRNVGIGTNAPEQSLHVYKDDFPGVLIEGKDPGLTFDDTDSGGARYYFLNRDGELRLNGSGSDRLTVRQNGDVSIARSLEIRGGADIVERFDSTEELEAGTVVVIDAKNPGELVASTESYDTKVAGVVSGAGGVNPGICLSQDGELDGDNLVAMNGRVYVKATAANGPIEAGDLLTTSNLVGHCMKVTDRTKAHGTVIGKAMSPLESGEGLVLVLVNLQ